MRIVVYSFTDDPLTPPLASFPRIAEESVKRLYLVVEAIKQFSVTLRYGRHHTI